MRKLICCLALSCFAASMVVAGPGAISSSGKEMKQVAPMPPACPSWTGFYVGGFGGYKVSNVDTDFTANDEIREHGEDLGPALESELSHDLDNDGAELGGVIGFNYQWHNWVFGLEG